MELKLTVQFDAPVHHGSGYGLAGVVDRAALRDAKGIPYLAGSALKGKFRYAASLILRGRGEPTCGLEGDYCRGKACAVCEIFGSPMKAGAAIFDDAYPKDRALLEAITAGSRFVVHSPDSEVRMNTAIDRHSRTVRPRHLFSTEAITIVPEFEGRISGSLTPDQTRLLEDSAAILAHFGSGSARGLGLCRYTLVRVEK